MCIRREECLTQGCMGYKTIGFFLLLQDKKNEIRPNGMTKRPAITKNKDETMTNEN